MPAPEGRRERGCPPATTPPTACPGLGRRERSGRCHFRRETAAWRRASRRARCQRPTYPRPAHTCARRTAARALGTTCLPGEPRPRVRGAGPAPGSHLVGELAVVAAFEDAGEAKVTQLEHPVRAEEEVAGLDVLGGWRARAGRTGRTAGRWGWQPHEGGAVSRWRVGAAPGA